MTAAVVPMKCPMSEAQAEHEAKCEAELATCWLNNCPRAELVDRGVTQIMRELREGGLGESAERFLSSFKVGREALAIATEAHQLPRRLIADPNDPIARRLFVKVARSKRLSAEQREIIRRTPAGAAAFAEVEAAAAERERHDGLLRVKFAKWLLRGPKKKRRRVYRKKSPPRGDPRPFERGRGRQGFPPLPASENTQHQSPDAADIA